MPASVFPKSSTRATCSLRKLAAMRASLRNRATISSLSRNSGRTHLSATAFWRCRWMASVTMPIPPHAMHSPTGICRR